MKTSASWIGLGLKEKNIKTAIHFFPYSGTITATYPVDVSLTIFGEGLETLNVNMEGALLCQPDGLEVEKVFPALLSDYQGFYGIKIELICTNENISLSPSVCLFEIIKPDGSIKFQPKNINQEYQVPSGICWNYNKEQTSIVVLNCSQNEVTSGFPAGLVKLNKKASNKLNPFAVNEFQISSDYLKSGINTMTSNGNFVAQKFEIKNANTSLVYFALNRSLENSNPCSVYCL